MKKLLAILLTLILSLGLVACNGGGSGETEEAPPPQEGFGGVWYNSAGRKLELKEDGTYLLADEVEGGKWEKKSETEGECTDAYGTFSVTYAKDESGESLVFGPYGTFRRATEEQVARYESALRKPIINAHLSEDCAMVFWNDTEQTNLASNAVINNEGLVLGVPSITVAATVYQFYEDVILTAGSVVDKKTGNVLHSGNVLSYNEEYIVLGKSYHLTNGSEYYYAVVDAKGNLAVDWTPYPTLIKDGKKVNYPKRDVQRPSGLLIAFYDAGTYYVFNPLTGKTFRLERLDDSLTAITEDGMVFKNYSFAPDWTSPAQPTGYEAFTLREDGTPVQAVAPEGYMLSSAGNFFLEYHLENREPKGVTLRNRTTGETFYLDYPIAQHRDTITIVGNYGCATYTTYENERYNVYAVLFDTKGNILCEPIRVEGWIGDNSRKSLSEDGFLALCPDEDEVIIYDKTGEQVFAGSELPAWFHKQDRRLTEKGIVDAAGRVLIPHITFLPAEMK